MDVRYSMIGLWRLAVVFVMVWPAPVTWGQNRVGNGRALDANLQQGSGGINQAQQPVNFSAGNDIVTGNVPGLGYFRGEVNYTAPNEFRGDLGGVDDLFRFRAQSLSTVLSPAMGGGGRSVLGQSRVSVYRDFSGVGIGDVRRNALGGVGPSGGLGGPNKYPGLVVRPRGYDVGAASSSTLAGVDLSPDAHRQPLGFNRQPDGRLLEVSASPLLGLRRRVIDERAAVLIGGGDEIDGRSPIKTLGEGGLVSFVPPSIEIGRQVLGMIDRGRVGHPGLPSDERISQIEAGLFLPLEVPEASSEGEPYLDLLSKIRDSQKDSSAAVIEDRTGVAAGKDEDPASKEATPNRPDSLGQLINTLGYNLPRVKTLAGEKDDRLNQLIRRAQGEIREGQYLDAQEHFQQVLRLSPNNPMGRVGLVHAQIGAGMIRTALLNMRWLFERHPELIAARYDASLLPGAPRLEWLREELMHTIEMGSSAEPALLLAYVGYQTAAPGLVEYGLKLAAERMPDDELVALLREIWLKENRHNDTSGSPSPEPQK